MKRAIYKVPNGKLLKIALEEEGGTIKMIKITGDFFIYPEENLEKMEVELLGCEMSAGKLSITIDEFIKVNPTELFGLDEESLIQTILNAK